MRVKKLIIMVLVFVLVTYIPVINVKADTGGVGVYPSYVSNDVVPGEYLDKDLNVVNKSDQAVNIKISSESDIDTDVVISKTSLVLGAGETAKFNVKTLIKDESIAEQIVKVHVNILSENSKGVAINSILEIPIILKNSLAEGSMDFSLGDSGFRGNITEINKSTVLKMLMFSPSTWKSMVNDSLVYNHKGDTKLDLKKEESLEFYCEVNNDSPFTFVATSNTIMYPSFVDLDNIGDNQPSLNANVGNLLIKAKGEGESKFQLKPTDVYKLKSEYDSYKLITKVSVKGSDEVKEIRSSIKFGSIRYLAMASVVIFYALVITLIIVIIRLFKGDKKKVGKHEKRKKKKEVGEIVKQEDSNEDTTESVTIDFTGEENNKNV